MKLKRLSYMIFLVGLTVFMFPHVNKVFFTTSNQISFNSYEDTVSIMSEEEINRKIEEIRLYNESLMNAGETANLPLDVEIEEANTLEPIEEPKQIASTEYIDPFIGGVKVEESPIKSVVKTGAFGYIKIPRINETLPIYLGASEEHLAKGVGQIEETSLPIGGLGTNSVLAGHRGYYRGAQIFKHLDKLRVGDRFYIHVFNQVLTYVVTGNEVILPNQTEKLNIDPNKDQVTLLTCTPYRVSSHRLLVYAERLPEEQSLEDVSLEENGLQGTVIRGVLSENARNSNPVSTSVRNDQLLSYIIVIVGGILWIVTFILLIKSFTNPKNKQALESQKNDSKPKVLN